MVWFYTTIHVSLPRIIPICPKSIVLGRIKEIFSEHALNRLHIILLLNLTMLQIILFIQLFIFFSQGNTSGLIGQMTIDEKNFFNVCCSIYDSPPTVIRQSLLFMFSNYTPHFVFLSVTLFGRKNTD